MSRFMNPDGSVADGKQQRPVVGIEIRQWAARVLSVSTATDGSMTCSTQQISLQGQDKQTTTENV